MRIGQLAERSGTQIETIRYYEHVGLIPAPMRSTSGYREFSPEDLQRLAFVRRCRELGFSIKEIRSLLMLAKRRDSSCTNVTRLAAQHLKEVRQRLADLQRLERALDTLILSCANGRVADCKILETLGRVD